VTTRRAEILMSRIKPVGEPRPAPSAPRPFDAAVAVAVLEELMGSGATVRYGGEVLTRHPELLEPVGDAGPLWSRFLAFLEHLHDHKRWATHRGVPDSVVMAAELEAAGRVAEEVGQAAADTLAEWLRSRWTSAWRCCWCGGRSGIHESRGRVLP
jgi:hypothetical protein